MSDRLVIEIAGALPEKGKHAILAAAEDLAEALAAKLKELHQIDATVSVRGVRPGKKGGAGAPVVPLGQHRGDEAARTTSSELGLG